MRQESNHRMNSGDKESPRISNSRAMGVIILIVLLFVFQVTAFVVQKVRIAALERDAVAVESAAAAQVRAAAAESGEDDTLSGLDSRSGAGVLPKYGKRARSRSSSGLGKKTMAERFPFDPNDISLDSLQLLGFSRKQAQTILNYRNKGGKFRQKKDFAKMYVVDSAMYTSLAPYILLPDRYPVKSAGEGNLVPKRAISGTKPVKDGDLVPKRAISGTKLADDENLVPNSSDSGTKPVEEEVFGQKVERNRYMCNLNTADSAALVRLYGIGGYYARKILQYRERLGGSFVSPRQLLEIDGFTQERYSRIEKSIFVREEDIKGFSLLNAERSALERHPYIGPYAARGIVTYLRVKGRPAEDALSSRAEIELSLLKELVKERILTPENARKLEEYLLYL